MEAVTIVAPRPDGRHGPAGSAPAPLPTREAHVWSAWLDQPEERVVQLARVLSDDECRRATKLRFERHRRRFVAARGLLRLLLGQYLGLAPERLRFRGGPSGRPALDVGRGGAELAFGLSVADGLAFYAVAPAPALGIDVERLDSVDADRVARGAERDLSAPERAALRALPEAAQRGAFLDCWTRKNAYLKASREGMGRPPRQVRVSLPPAATAGPEAVEWDPSEVGRWSLLPLTPAPGYVGALALPGHGWRTAAWRWPLGETADGGAGATPWR
jgi:4'-phosphopantetheinyl transferase